jgi:hypothetical protein
LPYLKYFKGHEHLLDRFDDRKFFVDRVLSKLALEIYIGTI